jgi:hypothetical protein
MRSRQACGFNVSQVQSAARSLLQFADFATMGLLAFLGAVGFDYGNEKFVLTMVAVSMLRHHHRYRAERWHFA